jgi:hypothetical protein
MVGDCPVEFPVDSELPPVVHVGLHRPVPGFHTGVVGHSTRSVHALADSGAGQNLSELPRQELHTPVAVEDCAHLRLALTQCRTQRPHRQRRSALGAHPSRRLLCRSMMVARYHQAPETLRYVTSPTQIWFGRSTVMMCSPEPVVIQSTLICVEYEE